MLTIAKTNIMIDERIIELYRSQLAASNEEKGMLYAQVKSLTEEVSMLRQSVEQSKHDTSEQVKELLSDLKSLHEEVKPRTSGYRILKNNCHRLYAESMGKFEELHLGRTGSVKQ